MPRARWKKSHKGKELRSGFELKTAKFLDEKKIKYKYEELKVSYVVPEAKRTYTPDFQLPNGIVVECKGRFSAADRKKMGLAIEQNPDLDIRMLFMLDNTISKVSKTKYSDWCEKRGIKWHVAKDGSIPQEWLDETKTTRRTK